MRCYICDSDKNISYEVIDDETTLGWRERPICNTCKVESSLDHWEEEKEKEDYIE